MTGQSKTSVALGSSLAFSSIQTQVVNDVASGDHGASLAGSNGLCTVPTSLTDGSWRNVRGYERTMKTEPPPKKNSADDDVYVRIAAQNHRGNYFLKGMVIHRKLRSNVNVHVTTSAV